MELPVLVLSAFGYGAVAGLKPCHLAAISLGFLEFPERIKRFAVSVWLFHVAVVLTVATVFSKLLAALGWWDVLVGGILIALGIVNFYEQRDHCSDERCMDECCADEHGLPKWLEGRGYFLAGAGLGATLGLSPCCLSVDAGLIAVLTQALPLVLTLILFSSGILSVFLAVSIFYEKLRDRSEEVVSLAMKALSLALIGVGAWLLLF
ncbi:hypothetical protein AKJ36_01605 [candidate division MSBL1 archaeon SCGC-AAA259I07]|uniref:Uncharacterized protein n=1 Tax=candidate division MSBL1 archaeon SCGC-AAA259I07 TaxID=1698266 RepID=A0A133ULG1_9EURY|nr:hypothetical protein AKJ36_01605 [candidate division MSBL1 archaeon SCGC-AAA259I07]